MYLAMYGPIYKQSNDYQDLKQLFVIPMHYGFKEYFYKQKKNRGKLEFYA